MGLFSKTYDLSLIRTTSKDALKRSAYEITGGDVAEAQKIYDFFAKDMEDMPAYDIPQPSGFEKVKGEAAGLFEWIDGNSERIFKYINLVQTMRGKAAIPFAPVVDVPPIP